MFQKCPARPLCADRARETFSRRGRRLPSSLPFITSLHPLPPPQPAGGWVSFLTWRFIRGFNPIRQQRIMLIEMIVWEAVERREGEEDSSPQRRFPPGLYCCLSHKEVWGRQNVPQVENIGFRRQQYWTFFSFSPHESIFVVIPGGRWLARQLLPTVALP